MTLREYMWKAMDYLSPDVMNVEEKDEQGEFDPMSPKDMDDYYESQQEEK